MSGSDNNRDWMVLLIGGPSGAGKSTAAAEIGQRLGIPWLQVDDLRLALQNSRVSLPEKTDALYLFHPPSPEVFLQPPEVIRDQLITVGEVMTPAIEIVAESHVHTGVPIVIEGDGILPSLLDRERVALLLQTGSLRAVFVSEPDEDALFSNMLARGRGIDDVDSALLRAEAGAKSLFGRWLQSEAQRRRLPVVDARPWDTLVDRILSTGHPVS